MNRDRLRVQLYSDPRFENVVAEVFLDDKFLLSLRNETPGEFIVELRSEDFVPGTFVEEIDLSILIDALGRAKERLVGQKTS
jgi:hypothetical protein